MNRIDLAVGEIRKTQNFVFNREASANALAAKLDENLIEVKQGAKQLENVKNQIRRIYKALDDKGIEYNHRVEIKEVNEVESALQGFLKVREYLFDYNCTPHGTMLKLDLSINRLNELSKAIYRYENDLNILINDLNKKGLFNTDIVAAYTGLDKEKAEEFKASLDKAIEEIAA